MVTPSEIHTLIGQLRGVTSPVARITLLSRAWRTLRKMKPEEMRELASQLGLGKADGLLHRVVASKGKVDIGMIMEAARQFQDTEAGRLREMVTGLRNPKRRGELIREGLDEVERRLAEDSAAAHAESPEPPGPPDLEAFDLDVSEPEEHHTVPPGVQTPVLEETRTDRFRIEAARPVDAEPSVSHAGDSQSAEAPQAPLLSPSVPPASESVVRAPRIAPLPAAPTAVTAPAHEVSPAGASASLMERLGSENTSLRRLRVLREGVRESGLLEPHETHELLELFPSGWVRRRALATLLRAGLPGRLDLARELIDSLESPMSRRWCAAILIDRAGLAPAEKTSLAARYRLARRFLKHPEIAP